MKPISKLKALAKELKAEFDTEALVIPTDLSAEKNVAALVAKLAKRAGADPLLIGFGEEGDMIHAPNESFSLKQFESGYRYVTSFLSRL